MAIHDAVYPTRPATLQELRWRLLFIFEERVGRRISEATLHTQQREDAAFDRLRQVVG